jgi:hypothetical protein
MSDFLDALKGLAANTPAGLVTSTVATVLDHVLPESQATRDAAAIKLGELAAAGTFEQKAQAQAMQGQLDANKAEAEQGGTHFRDGAGWVCVAGFGLVVLRPLIEWGAVLAGHPVTLPAIDTSETGPMLVALLGLGGYHAAPAIVSAVKGKA